MESISIGRYPQVEHSFYIDGLIYMSDDLEDLSMRCKIASFSPLLPVKLEGAVGRLFLSGACKYRINGEDIVLRPKDMLITAPFTIIEDFEEIEEIAAITVAFPYDASSMEEDDVHQSLTKWLLLGNGVETIHLSDEHFDIFTSLYREVKRCSRATTESHRHMTVKGILSIAAGLVASICEESMQSASESSGQVTKRVRQFINDVRTFCKSEHQVSFYAARCHVAEKYFARLIKKETGKTPGQIIQERLVLEAQVLLEDDSKTVAAIAEELCFSTGSSFLQWYKNKTGKTPNVYRRERKSLEDS